VVRQSQNYFAAAVSAAVLNAAAVAAFVLFTVFSSVQGFPLSDLLGAVNSIGPSASSSSSADGQASPPAGAVPDRTAGQGAGLAGGKDGAGGGEATTDPSAENASGGGRGSNPDTGSPGETGSGGSGAGGSGDGGIGSGPILGPIDPTPGNGLTGPVGPALQGAGNTVSQLPSTVNNTVNNTVSGLNSGTGGQLSDAGLTQPVQGATNTLLGPGSLVGQAANTTGGTLQGAGGNGGGVRLPVLGGG
jgi:hypothetical protein